MSVTSNSLNGKSDTDHNDNLITPCVEEIIVLDGATLEAINDKSKILKVLEKLAVTPLSIMPTIPTRLEVKNLNSPSNKVLFDLLCSIIDNEFVYIELSDIDFNALSDERFDLLTLVIKRKSRDKKNTLTFCLSSCDLDTLNSTRFDTLCKALEEMPTRHLWLRGARLNAIYKDETRFNRFVQFMSKCNCERLTLPDNTSTLLSESNQAKCFDAICKNTKLEGVIGLGEGRSFGGGRFIEKADLINMRMNQLWFSGVLHTYGPPPETLKPTSSLISTTASTATTSTAATIAPTTITASTAPATSPNVSTASSSSPVAPITYALATNNNKRKMEDLQTETPVKKTAK